MPSPGAAIYAAPVIAGCAVLSWAGLEKLRDRAPLTRTLGELGMRVRLAAIVAISVPLLELGAVIAVVSSAPPAIPGVLFAALGVSFAAAALWGIYSGRRVACACFGASARSLGWQQVAVLPLWLLAAWSVARMPPFSVQERLGGLACGALVLAAVRAIPAAREGIGVRKERRAADGGLMQ